MKLPICQHQDCGNTSLTGVWCQSCIEEEWPHLAIGDGVHWLVWKGVTLVPPGLYLGSAGCPYILQEPIMPGSHSPFDYEKSQDLKNPLMRAVATRDFQNAFPCNWLLSPIEVLNNNVGSHVMACIVNARFSTLQTDQILESISPALPVAAFPRNLIQLDEVIQFESRPLGEQRDRVDFAESIFAKQAEQEVGKFERVMHILRGFERSRRAEMRLRYNELDGREISKLLFNRTIKKFEKRTASLGQWLIRGSARYMVRSKFQHKDSHPKPKDVQSLNRNILKGFKPGRE